jgi:hypothetical protein
VAQQSKTDLLKTHANELVKTYVELDGAGRASKLYTTQENAPHGAPCLVTEYIYQSPVSTVVKGTKEGVTTWDSTWVPDSAFTVSTS